MIRGYRWVKTSADIWQYEGRPRCFHGMVREHGDGRATYCLPGGYDVCYSDGRYEERGQGERDSVRLAKDEVEAFVRNAVGDEPCPR